ncbi:MAG: 3-hydroxyacyl-CoA dehydrogenase NAD-binding domain-containing protein, partial [Alphaproteobacteria bacterium]
RLGLLDELIEGDLKTGAIAFARRVLAENRGVKRASALPVAPVAADFFANYEAGIARRLRGFKAPFNIIKSVQAAAELPFAAGMQREAELFQELMTSSESRAQRHVFFAEREVAKIPGLPKDTAQREIKTAAVIGAGTMGGGIAMNFANAGIPVTLLEINREALDRGIGVIRKNYEATASKGRLTAADVEKRMGLITPSTS